MHVVEGQENGPLTAMVDLFHHPTDELEIAVEQFRAPDGPPPLVVELLADEPQGDDRSDARDVGHGGDNIVQRNLVHDAGHALVVDNPPVLVETQAQGGEERAVGVTGRVLVAAPGQHLPTCGLRLGQECLQKPGFAAALLAGEEQAEIATRPGLSQVDPKAGYLLFASDERTRFLCTQCRLSSSSRPQTRFLRENGFVIAWLVLRGQIQQLRQDTHTHAEHKE